MPSQRDVLAALKRDELLKALDTFGLEVADRRVRDQLIDALARSRAFRLDEWLHNLSRDRLKEICRDFGLDDSGRAKADIVERLLPSRAARSTAPAVKEPTAQEAPKKRGRPPKQDPEPASTKGNGRLETSALEGLLWDAACVIRGPVDAPKFKDYILPLIFLKRLCDVYDDEIDHLTLEFGDRGLAEQLARDDHRQGGKLVRFYIPEVARWEKLRNLPNTKIGQALTDAVRAVARENQRLQGVIDITDFNATSAGQPIVDGERLDSLVEILSDPKYRLGLDDVEPDVLGRSYEYLLRKFSEGQGQSGGERFTPPEVARTMARILDPQPGETVYDPCTGSGGLLIKCHLRLLETHGEEKNGRRRLPPSVAPLRLHGQEIEPSTYAISHMNAVIYDLEADVRLGDTMKRPAFTQGTGRLQLFDLVTANPMWNQKFGGAVYENDSYERFTRGVPPTASADWGWLQHMLAHLDEDGRMAVVLDTGAVSRGSGNQGTNKERDIRKIFIDEDLVEAVVLFADNLFYNTSAPATVVVMNREKQHAGEILLVNASKLFAKGRPKNYLTEEHIARIADVCCAWRTEDGFSAVIKTDDAVKSDYNLSPSRYVSPGEEADVLPLDAAIVLLAEAEEERAEADRQLNEVLTQLGFEGWRNG